MEYGMYIVGAVIFGSYMYFTAWNIIVSGKTQKKENLKANEQEKIDYDGTGEFDASERAEATKIKQGKK